MITAACSQTVDFGSTTAATVTTIPVEAVVTVSDEFERVEIGMGSERWVVAVADSAELRAQGLMRVTDLDDVRGMLFVFPGQSTGSFWMWDTAMPLDIAFFASDGEFVSQTSMVPCREHPCPVYRADGPYRYAVETVVGGFDALGELTLDLPLSDG